jgi:class 3 adenylate cyclase/tetratricopeptide (TPR) repeat protein
MAQTARKERKVVTVLFADLVGFTSRAETRDPEDVEAILRPYHQRLRSELERHGGTVEKFIGDAVMAVFGAPVVHEDDPERAVRAALAIREWAAEADGLEVRIAVNTGEALVSLDARPEAGEAMVAGDVVNTAARLQAAAPVNGILVGEHTYRSTGQVVDYREADAVEAKGKAEPVPVWEAVQARAAFGIDVRQLARTELVGREAELHALRDALARVREERQPRSATLVGAPGLGKSRLVYELFRTVEAEPELVYWRQGRCLPYGDGVTYWALAEVAKAQAGILETDSFDDAEAKLRRTVSELVGEGGEAEWVVSRLRPLVGLGDEGPGGESRQAESFFAWRRFLEAVASERTLVLVFEDLHWADEGFLDFVQHLHEWAVDVPLFLICTSRPELLTRRPGWPDTVQLSPLSDEATATLVHGLLERLILPAEVHAALLERAGGNPLYAEEFARMVGERGPGRELPLPETVQGVIAARIDGLSAEEKELLQDAAVVGKVFWAGAIATIAGGDRWTLEERLQKLVRRELLRRERRSSVAGESEYAFHHVLVRDVAYGSIPRSERADKHRLAAEWLESLSEDRTEDRAELLAHHYAEALELARASGEAEQAQRLEEPARRYLVLAGDRAFPLDPPTAESYYRRALAALDADDPERARVSVKIADAMQEDGRLHEAVAGYEEAIPTLRSRGDVQAAGGAMVRLATALWRIGETTRSRAELEEAVELLEQEPVGPNLVRAYARTAVNEVVAGRTRAGLDWTTKALPLAEDFALHGEVVRLLQMRGLARQDLGQPGSSDDLRRALSLALEHGLGFETATSYTNLAEVLHASSGPADALEVLGEAIEFAWKHGLEHHAWWTRANTAIVLFDLGRWDEALRVTEEVVEWDRSRGGSQLEVSSEMTKALILAFRGEVATATALMERLLPKARAIEDVQTLAPALMISAHLALARGETAVARRLLEEADERTRANPSWRVNLLVNTAYIGAAVGAVDLAARQVDAAERDGRTPSAICSVVTARAIVAEARGDLESAADLYGDAAERWREFGSVLALGLVLLGLGRSRVRLGRFGEAAPPLAEARDLHARLGARPLTTEADTLLAEATAAAS